MWARGNTSNEASLVQCLYNSLLLALVCVAMEDSSLFPSLMPWLVLVISSSFDLGPFGHTDPLCCEIPVHGSPACRLMQTLAQSLSKENLQDSCLLIHTQWDWRKFFASCFPSPWNPTYHTKVSVAGWLQDSSFWFRACRDQSIKGWCYLRTDVCQLIESGQAFIKICRICHSQTTIYSVAGTSEEEIPQCEWFELQNTAQNRRRGNRFWLSIFGACIAKD